VIFVPKRRRKVIYERLRKHLGVVFKRLAEQKESKILEGHLLPDHVHMLLSIPPKFAVSQVVGFIKGKSAIHLARVYGETKRNFTGQHFLGAGIPRIDGGKGRAPDTHVYPEPGTRGRTIGEAGALALRWPPARWLQ
jgi:putative transposase